MCILLLLFGSRPKHSFQIFIFVLQQNKKFHTQRCLPSQLNIPIRSCGGQNSDFYAFVESHLMCYLKKDVSNIPLHFLLGS